jgi:hypothetical protein
MTIFTINGPLARKAVDTRTPNNTVDNTCQCRLARLMRKEITKSVYQNFLKIL